MSKENTHKVTMIPATDISFQEDDDLRRFQQLESTEYETGIKELSENIKAVGLLNPLIVIPGKKASYTVVAGNRRLQACMLAGWTKIPCVIRQNQDNFELAFSEQIQRVDLTDVERGVWIDRAVGHLKEISPYKDSEMPINNVLIHLSGILGKSPRTLAAWRQMAKGFTPEERQRVVNGQSAYAIQKEHAAVSGNVGGKPTADGKPAKVRKELTTEEKVARELAKSIKTHATSFVKSAEKMREILQFIFENQIEYRSDKKLIGAFKALQKAVAVTEKALSKQKPVIAINHV